MQTHKGFTMMIALVVMIVVGVFFLQSSERKGERSERSLLFSVQAQAKVLLENSIINAQRLAKEDNTTQNGTRQMTMMLKNNDHDYVITTSWYYVWCKQQECSHEAINEEVNITRGAMIESEVRSSKFPVRVYKKTLIMW